MLTEYIIILLFINSRNLFTSSFYRSLDYCCDTCERRFFNLFRRNHLQLWNAILLRATFRFDTILVQMQLLHAYDGVSLECSRKWSVSLRLFSWSSSIFRNIPLNIYFCTFNDICFKRLLAIWFWNTLNHGSLYYLLM